MEQVPRNKFKGLVYIYTVKIKRIILLNDSNATNLL